MICASRLWIIQDSICGVQQKGKAYWQKVAQQYHEKQLHKPFEICNTGNEESFKNRWNYIKQETNKFYAVIDHVVRHPKSVGGVVAVVRALPSSFHQCTCLGIPKNPNILHL
jgi:hypothetical protein